MKIEIIEKGTINSAVLGWARSRDLTTAPTPRDVRGLDASVNELPTAMFHFGDMMILERELCVTPRNHVIWARTSRVDDPRLFRVPVGFENPDHENARKIMQHLHDDGVHQDQWRMMLPLCALTSWTARLSYRDAIRLASYLHDVGRAIKATNPKLAERLLLSSANFLIAVPDAFGLTLDAVIEAFENFKRMPVSVAAQGFTIGRVAVGSFTSLTVPIPIALRAQLARHREISMRDDFLNMLTTPTNEQLGIGNHVVVQAVALDSTWKAVLGKRTCWMAQADLWKPLADLYGAATDGLPCAGGVCPYAEDAKQRLAGNDPGAPCPRYSNLTGAPMTDHQWEAAYTEAKARPDNVVWKNELGVSEAPITGALAGKVVTKGQAPATGHPPAECRHAQGCPFPRICAADGHCDAAWNGNR